MILIAGDSWGVGEWNNGNIEHNGLAQYLTDSGHIVFNVSVPGGGNQEAVWNLEKFLLINHQLLDSIQAIVYFQTEWTRDNIPDRDIISSSDFEHLQNQWTNKCYYELDYARKKHNLSCDFFVVGGTSDAVEYGATHNNITVICESFTELLLDTKLDRVHSWWVHRSEELVKRIKNLRPDMVENLLHSIEKGHARQELCNQNPQWFKPDGAHANRHAHKKLYDKISELNIVSHQVASGSSHFKHSASSNLLNGGKR